MTIQTNKYAERKWLIGLSSFVVLLVLSILEANKILVVPDMVQALLSGITSTWLVVEGILDYTKIKSNRLSK